MLQDLNYEVMREWKARRKERKASRHQLPPQSTPAERVDARALRMSRLLIDALTFVGIVQG
jgi:hypothetical protein